MNRLNEIRLIAGVLATVAAVALFCCYFEMAMNVSIAHNSIVDSVAWLWQESISFKIIAVASVTSACICAPVAVVAGWGLYFGTMLLWLLNLDATCVFEVTLALLVAELCLIIFSIVMLGIQASLCNRKKVSLK